MRVNPTALAFWLFAGCAGHLLGDARGALVGVTIALGISVFAGIRR